MKTYILGSGGLAKRFMVGFLDHNKTEKEIKIEGFITFLLENDDESVTERIALILRHLRTLLILLLA